MRKLYGSRDNGGYDRNWIINQILEENDDRFKGIWIYKIL